MRDFTHLLKFGDAIAGYFTECSGIGSEHEVVEYREGNAGNDNTSKLPGKLVWHDITLRRNITSDMTIWQWRQDMIADTMSNLRKNTTIALLDRNHTPLAVWHFSNAWPRSVTLNPRSDDIAIEELVICHEGMYREEP